MEKLEMAFHVQFWDQMLQQFQGTGMQLQTTDVDLSTAGHGLHSLESFLAALQEELEKFAMNAKDVLRLALPQLMARCCDSAYCCSYRLCHPRIHTGVQNRCILYQYACLVRLAPPATYI